MQTGMQNTKAAKSVWRLGASSLFLLAAALCLPTVSHGAVTYTVAADGSGTHTDIQKAVNDCPDEGCVIKLADTLYNIPREIWIQQKSNLTIQPSDALVAKNIKPRIYYPDAYSKMIAMAGTARNPSDPARTAGWREWPKASSDVSQQAFDSIGLNIKTSGFQQNGFIVIIRSKNVTISGVKVDGRRYAKADGSPWIKNMYVWTNGKYDVWFGNVGINLYQSYQTTVKNCEILNCYAGIYMNHRNVGGALAIRNPDDSDVANIVPMSRFGQMGDNLIEGNYIHNGVWGIYDESEWDLASTIRHNIFRHNYDTAYATLASGGTNSNREQNNESGGMMFVKDAMLVPHKIYNNTIDNCALVIGHQGFKYGENFLFYNNLVTNNYSGANDYLHKIVTGSDNRLVVLKNYKDFVYSNTFAADTFHTRTITGKSDLTAAERTQMGLATKTVTFASPATLYTGMIDSNAGWVWNAWKVAKGGHFSALYKNVTYTLSDTASVNFYDVGGSIALMNSYDVSDRGNKWIKGNSFAYVDTTDPSSTDFMYPDTKQNYADSLAVRSGWTATGTLDKPWRGAKPAASQVLTLGDQQKVTILGDSISFNYDLSSTFSGWTNLKWETVAFYPKAFTSTSMAAAYHDARVLTPTENPQMNGGTFTAYLNPKDTINPLKLPNDSIARIDLVVSGTYNGETVRSNVGSWMWRKAAFNMNVVFVDSLGDTITTARAGDKVTMILTAMTNDSVLTRKIDSTYISSNRSMFSLTGSDTAQVTSSSPFSRGDSAVSRHLVYWSQTGTATVNVSGWVGTGLVSGSGSLKIRPGLPALVEWEDPPTYSAFDQTLPLDSVAATIKQGPSMRTLQVKDKFKNNVDVVSKVHVRSRALDPTQIVSPNLQFGPTSSGAWTTTWAADNAGPEYVAESDSNGLFTPYLNAVGVTGAKFWLSAYVDGKSDAVDSAVAKLGVPADVLYITPGSINEFTSQRIKLHVVLSLNGGTTVDSASGDANVKIAIGDSTGAITFYTDATGSETIKDSLQLVNGEADVWISADKALTDHIYVVRYDLNDGIPTVIPVTLKTQPFAKYPIVGTAKFIDSDCNGRGDQVSVSLVPQSSDGLVSLNDTVRVASVKVIIGLDTLSYDSSALTMNKTQTGFTMALKAEVGASPSGKIIVSYFLKRTALNDTVVKGGDYDITDGVAPQIDSIAMYENDTGMTDVFLVRFTEPVKYAGSVFPFLVQDSSGTARDVSGISVSSFELNATGTTIYKMVITGNRDAADVTKPKIIQYTDYMKINPAVTSLTDASGNPGAGCESFTKITKKYVLPSFTGTIGTNDSLGRANELRVTFTRPLRAAEKLTSANIRFSSYEQTVAFDATTWTQSATDSSTYYIHVPDTAIFAYGTTIGLADDGYGARIEFRGTNTDNGSTYDQFGTVKDSVPAVLVNFLNPAKVPAYAKLLFGKTSAGKDVDTLKIMLSEPVTLVNGTVSVRNLKTGNDVGTLDFIKVDDYNWDVVQNPEDANHVSAGDWITLGDRLMGYNDNLMPVQGQYASKAIVKGGDRPPTPAYYMDTLGRGTASQLRMIFPTHLTKAAVFTLTWGGVTVLDTLDSAKAVGRDTITLDLSKFGFPIGVTGPADGGVAKMRSISAEDTLFPLEDVSFSVLDQVAPVLDSAHMAYGSYTDATNSQDTLYVTFSEAVTLDEATAAVHSILIKRQTSSALETSVGLKMTLLAGGTSAYVFYDTASTLVVPVGGDSVRLIEKGAVADSKSNQVGTLSRYVIVTAGERPAIAPTIKIVLPGASSGEYLLTPTERSNLQNSYGSNVIISVHRNGASSSSSSILLSNTTKAAVGSAVQTATTYNTIGVDIPANKGTITTHSVLAGYVYDKYGIYVGKASADLYPDEFNNVGDATGKFNIQILWDGHAANGALVTSGIYAMRIVLIQDIQMADGSIQNRVKWNYVKNVGVQR